MGYNRYKINKNLNFILNYKNKKLYIYFNY